MRVSFAHRFVEVIKKNYQSCSKSSYFLKKRYSVALQQATVTRRTEGKAFAEYLEKVTELFLVTNKRTNVSAKIVILERKLSIDLKS